MNKKEELNKLQKNLKEAIENKFSVTTKVEAIHLNNEYDLGIQIFFGNYYSFFFKNDLLETASIRGRDFDTLDFYIDDIKEFTYDSEKLRDLLNFVPEFLRNNSYIISYFDKVQKSLKDINENFIIRKKLDMYEIIMYNYVILTDLNYRFITLKQNNFFSLKENSVNVVFDNDFDVIKFFKEFLKVLCILRDFKKIDAI